MFCDFACGFWVSLVVVVDWFVQIGVRLSICLLLVLFVCFVSMLVGVCGVFGLGCLLISVCLVNWFSCVFLFSTLYCVGVWV